MSTTSSTSSTSSTLFNMSGFNLTNGQGIDVSSIVSTLVTAASVPESQWQTQQTSIKSQISDLQTIESAVTSLLSYTSSLASPAGTLVSRTTSSTDTSLVSASAANGTASGSHTVVVSNLATTSSYYTNQVASASTTLASGTFDISVGGSKANTITIDSTNNTLTGLVSTINAANIGVTASVITDANGSRLALVSKSSGSAGDVTVSNVSSGETSLQFTKAVTGQNASLTVDGVPVSSASNTVTGVVTGLTLNLNGADANTTVNVTVSPDNTTVETTIANFVSGYNTIMGYINTEYSTSSGTAGPLSGDSSLSMLQNYLLNSMGYTTGTSSAVNSIADLGITMNEDGTITLNNTTLDTTVNNNFSAVQTFLQGDGTGTTGLASVLKTQLNNMTDATTGAFTVDISSLNSSVSSLQSQIDDFQTYIDARQQAWTDQYNTLNVTLKEYPIQMKMLQAELGNSNYANITT